MPPSDSPGLYGISEANSSRHGKDGANELIPERRFDSAVLACHYANRETNSEK